jgi:nucleoside-diphosphate-sugar epimerase
MKTVKVLITGGAGYIGSVLVHRMLESGYEVTVLDNLMYRQSSLTHLISHKNFNFRYGDVRNLELLKELVNKNDIIIPLAAIVGAPACSKDPILASSINKNSVFELLKLVHESQLILMPTTNSAYGKGPKDGFCDENSPLNPISLYARDKVLVEQRLMEHSNAVSFRLATAFGVSPRMRLDLLLNDFTFRAAKDGFIVVFEGQYRRNFIHVDDIASAFLLGITRFDQFRGEIFNVGLSEANLNKIELCKIIKSIVPNFVYLESEFGADPDQRDYLVSNKKIEALGFSPQKSVEFGIHEILKAFPFFSHTPHNNL